MPVKINGATSGSVTLAAPATGSDVTLTLPAAAGTAATTAYADTAGGLTLINTTSVAAQSSVSINNVFTATYQNYKIIYNASPSAASTTFELRMRAAGSDTSTGVYDRGQFFANTSTLGFNTGASAATSGRIASLLVAGIAQAGSLEIYAPQTPTHTNITTESQNWDNFFGGFVLVKNSVQYDGITLFLGTGNFTGTIRVYGYKNS